MSWPPPQRADRFNVGDEVWWNIPTVMDACNTWAPDITKPVKVIAVRDHKNTAHAQLVRVSPNYCPWGDEFDGTWLLPVGIRSHNDDAYRNRPDFIHIRWDQRARREIAPADAIVFAKGSAEQPPSRFNGPDIIEESA